MKYARIVNNTIINATSLSPAEAFHPAVVAEFESVPEHVDIGWQLIDDTWHAPNTDAALITNIEEEEQSIKLTPSEFMLLFTSPERLKLKALRAEDPILNDFFELIEHPTLVSIDLSRESTISALTYCHSLLVTAGIIPEEQQDQRLAEILSGTVL